jgi:hypothetical protein
VSGRNRGHRHPGTGAASQKCQPATGATVSSMNRVRTHALTLSKPIVETHPVETHPADPLGDQSVTTPARVPLLSRGFAVELGGIEPAGAVRCQACSRPISPAHGPFSSVLEGPAAARNDM